MRSATLGLRAADRVVQPGSPSTRSEESPTPQVTRLIELKPFFTMLIEFEPLLFTCFCSMHTLEVCCGRFTRHTFFTLLLLPSVFPRSPLTPPLRAACLGASDFYSSV